MATGHLMGDLCDRGLDLRLSLVLMHFKRTSQQPRVACGPNVMPGPAAAGWGGVGAAALVHFWAFRRLSEICFSELAEGAVVVKNKTKPY